MLFFFTSICVFVPCFAFTLLLCNKYPRQIYTLHTLQQLSFEVLRFMWREDRAKTMQQRVQTRNSRFSFSLFLSLRFIRKFSHLILKYNIICHYLLDVLNGYYDWKANKFRFEWIAIIYKTNITADNWNVDDVRLSKIYFIHGTIRYGAHNLWRKQFSDKYVDDNVISAITDNQIWLNKLHIDIYICVIWVWVCIWDNILIFDFVM